MKITGLALLMLFSLGLSPAMAADYTKDPVLLVHGYFLGDFLTWASIKSKLKDDGWPEEFLVEVDFANVVGCNPQHGQEIAAKVQHLLAVTGRQKVDIVAHSMGAIDTRFYIKFLCGYKYVKDVVMIAGANKGTTVACVDPLTCAADSMCVGFGKDDWKENSFLANLNACDMTPGDDIKYTSVWTGWDEIIIPQENSEIPGAVNHKISSWFVGHGGILLNGEAYEWVKKGLDGGGTNNNTPDGTLPCHTICLDPVVPDPDPEPMPDVVEESDIAEPMEIIEQGETIEQEEIIDQWEVIEQWEVVEQWDAAGPQDSTQPTEVVDAADSVEMAPSDLAHDNSPEAELLTDIPASDTHYGKDGSGLTETVQSADTTQGDGPIDDQDSSSQSTKGGGCSASPVAPSKAPLLLLALAMFALALPSRRHRSRQ